MMIDAVGAPTGPLAVGETAVAAERAGFDHYWVPEVASDATVGVAAAAGGTRTIGLGTGIMVALARNPMTVATAANDLQTLTGGRFVLGLGPQVAAHITRRFNMPWSRPAARMREFIQAILAVWDSWETGDRLDFRGEFYQHTLMPPAFNPGPNPHGRAPIYLAAVGPKMVETAGAVADGLLCHTFVTPRYLREVTLPALAAGCAEAGRPPSDVQVCAAPMIAFDESGDDDAVGGGHSVDTLRRQIAFYGSTPGYRPVLELHGLGDLGERLTSMAKRNQWNDMPALIGDEVLSLFAITGTPESVFAEIRIRYQDLADRVCVDYAAGARDAWWSEVLTTGRRELVRNDHQPPISARPGGCSFDGNRAPPVARWRFS